MKNLNANVKFLFCFAQSKKHSFWMRIVALKIMFLFGGIARFLLASIYSAMLGSLKLFDTTLQKVTFADWYTICQNHSIIANTNKIQGSKFANS